MPSLSSFTASVTGVAIACLCAVQEDGDLPPAAIRTPMDFVYGSGSAVIRAEPTRVAQGQSFTIRCELRINGGTGELYNPFLWEGYTLPAQITIASSDGKKRFDLLHRHSTAGERAGPTAWLPPANAIGREFTVALAPEPYSSLGKPGNVRFLDLPAGDYLAQAIYNNWLTADRASDDTPMIGMAHKTKALPAFSRSRMAQPIIISEAAKFTVEAKRHVVQAERLQPDCPLQIELRPVHTKAIFGQHFEIEITVVNRSERIVEAYNPFLRGSLMIRQRAVDLIVFDEYGAPIGDLFARAGGSSGMPTKQDWVRIPPGGIVSSKYRFRLGDIPGTGKMGVDFLPPGKYFVELRARLPLLSTVPLAFTENSNSEEAMRTPSYQEWRQSFPGPEICRSNRVELEILPRTGD